MNNQALLLFAKTLAGQYSNKKQANINPRDFAHINIYFRPLSSSIIQGPWFYSEQSYDYDPWSPYKQGIHRIFSREDTYIVENYSLNTPERVAGSGFKPELLKHITSDNFYKREGCSMHFKEVKPGHYAGEVEAGKRCLIKRSHQLTYLISKVEFNKKEWRSIDEGFNTKNNKKVWGSDFGPLIFQKVIELGDQINEQWIFSDQN